jgi:haloacetate dehalogenase
MYDGFESQDLTVDGVRVHARVGGSGPPVLLLHGYPQTHVMWHGLAPELARSHAVVAADLRGYGDSDKPAGGPEHRAYSKRAMAADQVGLMAQLGFETFAAVGHDRGARVVHRMCLDHPDRVVQAAVLDIVPTRHVFANVDEGMALAYYHWFFLAQDADLPERLIGADPKYWIEHHLAKWSRVLDRFDPGAVAEYVRCFADPAAIAASCEDYRAAAGVDLRDDEADAAAGRRIGCPLLVLWGRPGFVGRHYDVVSIWREYADDVRFAGLDCGHFLPEEAPDQTLAALVDFLA